METMCADFGKKGQEIVSMVIDILKNIHESMPFFVPKAYVKNMHLGNEGQEMASMVTYISTHFPGSTPCDTLYQYMQRKLVHIWTETRVRVLWSCTFQTFTRGVCHVILCSETFTHIWQEKGNDCYSHLRLEKFDTP
ncbi:hypothetical protein ACF0H5_019452 [Mactra antiquata]